MVGKTASSSGYSASSTMDRFWQPSPRQAALLILHLLAEKPAKVTRARLTEITIRRLWNRSRVVDQAFLLEVQELLLQAGWAFFWARSSYALVRVEAVEGWPRISSKRIADDLEKVSRGHFDFDQLEPLLFPTEPEDEEAEDEPDGGDGREA